MCFNEININHIYNQEGDLNMYNKTINPNQSNKQYGEFHNTAVSYSRSSGNAPEAGSWHDEAEEIFVGRDKDMYVTYYGGIDTTKK
jgi:hypothetical protein